MHPHLADEKKLHCGDLIKELHECHEKGLLHKFMGKCNGVKHELNMCLREERLDRTARNREESKIRTEKKQKAWKDIEENR